MRLIKYYDQTIFKQVRKLIPARAKPHLGTVIEPNIFERSKAPIQRNNPSFTMPKYEKTINLTNFHYNEEADNEVSQSVLKIVTDYPTFEGEIDKSVRDFELPSLYKFAANDNFEDRNTYISGAVNYGGPSHVYQEATGAMVMHQRVSERNQEYKFSYNSEISWSLSSKYSIDKFENLYSSRSLHESDKDTGYQDTISLRRLFYEGVKNTNKSTVDGKSVIEVIISAPTKLVTTEEGDINLTTGDGTVPDFKSDDKDEKTLSMTFEEKRIRDIKKKKKKGLKNLKKKPESDQDRKRKVQIEKIEKEKKSGKLIMESDSSGKQIDKVEFKGEVDLPEELEK